VKVLKGAKIIEGRPGASLPPLDFDALKASLEEKHNTVLSDEEVMSGALYPEVFDDYMSFVQKFGPVKHLNTRIFSLSAPRLPKRLR